MAYLQPKWVKVPPTVLGLNTEEMEDSEDIFSY